MLYELCFIMFALNSEIKWLLLWWNLQRGSWWWKNQKYEYCKWI